MPKVGRYKIPASTDKGRPLRLLLDGHQRLSTLVYILGPGLKEQDLEEGEEERERWVFDVTASIEISSRERFVLLKPSQEPTKHQLPLSIALNRSKLNAWIRERRDLPEASTRLADNLRDRLRDYFMPVAVLATDDLAEATESFQRINSSGVTMSNLNMVAALAYNDDFDLLALLEAQIAEHLDPLGWADINPSDMMRVMAGILRQDGDSSQHPLKLDIKKLSVTLKQEKEQLVGRTITAMTKATELLKVLGVRGPKLLPYSYQLIIPAVILSREKAITLGEKAFERWFWLTTYGLVFQSLNSSVYDRALEGLLELNKDDESERLPMRRDVSRRVSAMARFDYRAARTKALVLTMARLQDRGNVNGSAHKTASKHGNSAIGLLLPSGKLSNWTHRAIIPAEIELKEIRDALSPQQDSRTESQRELLESLGFVVDQHQDVQELLTARAKRLEELEQEFVKELGFEWLP